MEHLSELDLPLLPIESPEFAADPFPYFSAARAKHPWLATSDFGFIVTEYQAMRELIRQDDKLSPAFDGVIEQMGVKGTPMGRWLAESIQGMPPDLHRWVRDAFAASFTPRFANELRPLIRKTVSSLLDEWAPKGEFDFEEFASWFPISVMFAILGAPVGRIGGIKADLETLGLAFSMDSSLAQALCAAFERIDALVQELITTRRANPHVNGRPDLLDVMIEASDSGGITDRQLADLLNTFMVAAYDTSKNVLTMSMRLLIDRPDIYRECADDLEHCRRTVDETLRYMSTSTANRITTEDVVYRDVLLPKHAMLFFPFSISGRDPGAFPDGETFDPHRAFDPNRHHIAFGLGRHMCPGQFIARAQLQEALHVIAQRLCEPKLAGPYGWRPFPGIWGMRGLPITFTPA